MCLRCTSDPRFQGAGIGGQLLERAEREARDRGADALWLGVMVKNTRALEWYKRNGFAFVEEAPFVMGASSADHLIGFRPLTDMSTTSDTPARSPLGLGPVALLRPGHPLRRGDDGFRHHVQAARHLQHRHRPVHELAVPPVGDQAALESVRRHVPDEAVLDRRAAVRDRRRARERRASPSPLPAFFQVTLAIFWLMAFASATHDIAADGFYMLGLPEHQQAAFVGVRSTFYRIAMITGQGLLVVVAGKLEASGDLKTAWSITFGLLPPSSSASRLSPVHAPPAGVGPPGRAPRAPAGVVGEFLTVLRRGSSGSRTSSPSWRSSCCTGSGGAARQARHAVPARSPRGGRARPVDGRGRDRVRDGRGHRPDARRSARRIRRLAPGATRMALADGVHHASAGPDVRVPVAGPARELRVDHVGGRGGAVRLRVRLHRVHAVHDPGGGRRAQDRALRDLHRVHGARDDAPRDGERGDPGGARIQGRSSSGSCSPRSRASLLRRWSKIPSISGRSRLCEASGARGLSGRSLPHVRISPCS